MNERIKKLWIESLRSGLYQQGNGRLRVGDKYCCLGVLCDLYDQEHGTSSWVSGDPITEEGCYVFRLSGDWDGYNWPWPPEIVSNWAGIYADPLDRNGIQLSLHNDGGKHGGKEITKKTFAEIAQIIEEDL